MIEGNLTMNDTNGVTLPNLRRKFRFTLNFTVFSIMLLIGAILVACYFIFPQFREQLTFISAVIGGLTAIYAGYYMAQNIKISIDRDKVHRSFEIVHRLDVPEFIEIRTFIEKGDIDQLKDGPENMYDKIKADDKLLKAVSSVLSMFENMSISIQRGYADELTLYLSCGYIVPFYYGKLSPYIIHLRNKHKNKAIGIEFEKLGGAWGSKIFLLSGKKIPEKILQL